MSLQEQEPLNSAPAFVALKSRAHGNSDPFPSCVSQVFTGWNDRHPQHFADLQDHTADKLNKFY